MLSCLERVAPRSEAIYPAGADPCVCEAQRFDSFPGRGLLVSDGKSKFLCDAGFGKLGLFEPVDLEKLNQGSFKNGHISMKLQSTASKTLQGFAYDVYTLWYDTGTAWNRGYCFMPVQDFQYVDAVPLNGNVYSYFESPFTQRLWIEKRNQQHLRILGNQLVSDTNEEKTSIRSARQLQQLLGPFGFTLAASLLFRIGPD